MKYLFCLLLALPAYLQAQYSISAGMGVNITSMNSLNNYIAAFAPPGERRDDLYTNVEFYGEAGKMISPDWELALGYFYSIYTYNTSYGGIGKYEIGLYSHAPTVLAYYVISGKGYNIKLGGGLGYRFAIVDETLADSKNAVTYNGAGPGAMLKIDGNTALDKNFYINIGLLLKADFPGVPENNSKKLDYSYKDEEVNVNTISAGVRFGLTYIF